MGQQHQQFRPTFSMPLLLEAQAYGPDLGQQHAGHQHQTVVLAERETPHPVPRAPGYAQPRHRSGRPDRRQRRMARSARPATLGRSTTFGTPPPSAVCGSFVAKNPTEFLVPVGLTTIGEASGVWNVAVTASPKPTAGPSSRATIWATGAATCGPSPKRQRPDEHHTGRNPDPIQESLRQRTHPASRKDLTPGRTVAAAAAPPEAPTAPVRRAPSAGSAVGELPAGRAHRQSLQRWRLP